MRIDVLSIPDCPNGPIAIERIRTAVREADVGDVTVEVAIVHDAGDTMAARMHGSPTILIDGRDPFAELGAVASISCRLYRTPLGPQGSPTVAELVEVIRSRNDGPGRSTFRCRDTGSGNDHDGLVVGKQGPPTRGLG